MTDFQDKFFNFIKGISFFLQSFFSYLKNFFLNYINRFFSTLKSFVKHIKDAVYQYCEKFRSAKKRLPTQITPTKKSKLNQKLNISVVFNLLIIGISIYLILAPIFPEISFYIKRVLHRDEVVYLEAQSFLELDAEANPADSEQSNGDQTQTIEDEFKEVDHNTVYIPMVGIKAPIVEGSSDEALSRGAWRRPNSSVPPQGGNTVITGHRFQYLPPNNLTFYHLNKVQKGDHVYIYWDDKVYTYVVDRIFEVAPSDIEIEQNTSNAQITLYTCTPLWTAKKRLVVIALPK
jgi:sortase A